MLDKLFGKGNERILDLAFKAMALSFRVRDWLIPPAKKVDRLLLQEGMVVVDYGSGSGSYLKPASERVGTTGRIYALDVHPLAVAAARERAETHGLDNMTAILVQGNDTGLDDNTADLIFAFDMFHMVEDPAAFLTELARILKPEGVLYIEDGHQSRAETRQKILQTGDWRVVFEEKNGVRCKRT
jgi:ubiquinone/menaquinone biosynthesis C-methylase UbiE